MNVLFFIAAAAPKSEVELTYVWNQSTVEAKIIIAFLLVFSIFSWSVMVAKAVQMREKVEPSFRKRISHAEKRARCL